jgi:hypothetical protein
MKARVIETGFSRGRKYSRLEVEDFRYSDHTTYSTIIIAGEFKLNTEFEIHITEIQKGKNG